MGKYKNVHRAIKSVNFKRFAKVVNRTTTWESTLANGAYEPETANAVKPEKMEEESISKVPSTNELVKPVEPRKEEPKAFSAPRKEDVSSDFEEGGVKTTFEAPKKVYGRGKDNKFGSKKEEGRKNGK